MRNQTRRGILKGALALIVTAVLAPFVKAAKPDDRIIIIPDELEPMPDKWYGKGLFEQLDEKPPGFESTVFKCRECGNPLRDVPRMAPYVGRAVSGGGGISGSEERLAMVFQYECHTKGCSLFRGSNGSR